VARWVEGQLEAAAERQLPLVTERVLVLIDGTPASARAVRRAASLAGSLHAALIAVVVETPELERQPFDRSRDLQEAIDDAVDLGAEVVRIEAPDVVAGLERAARSRRATHVVIPHREVHGFKRLVERSLGERLLERIPDIELHLVAVSQ
jgi:two-component system sensor histidine kinase KdpD